MRVWAALSGKGYHSSIGAHQALKLQAIHPLAHVGDILLTVEVWRQPSDLDNLMPMPYADQIQDEKRHCIRLANFAVNARMEPNRY